MDEQSEEETRSIHRQWVIIISLVVFLLFGVGIYIHRSRSTRFWPKTECTVVDSRVVRADFADSTGDLILFKGEYQLRYAVEGREYFVWEFSGWMDSNKQFIQGKVDVLPKRCDFDLRYNPHDPQEAVVAGVQH
jgi:hypothetical protein